MKRILVVDDEPDISSSIKRGLERNGFQVDAFSDPEKALAEFKPGMYDLLLVDIRMPKLNGFELYREIKKKNDQSKICFFTAFEVYYEEFKKVFPTLDVKCFIRKPITISDLVTHINTELNNKWSKLK